MPYASQAGSKAAERILATWVSAGERREGELWFDSLARLRSSFSPTILEAIKTVGDPETCNLAYNVLNHPFWSFEPRKDDPAHGDQQEGFIRSKTFISCALGGNGSHAPEDMIAGKRFEDHECGFPIITRNPYTGKAEVCQSSKPFVEGVTELFEWTFSDGTVLKATGDHRVVSANGTWTTLAESYDQNTPVLSDRGTHIAGDLCYSQITSSCLGDCYERCRQCGEQLLQEAEAFQSFLTSPFLKYPTFGIGPYLSTHLHANTHSVCQSLQSYEVESQTFSSPCSRSSALGSSVHQLLTASSTENSLTTGDLKFLAETFRQHDTSIPSGRLATAWKRRDQTSALELRYSSELYLPASLTGETLSLPNVPQFQCNSFDQTRTNESLNRSAKDISFALHHPVRFRLTGKEKVVHIVKCKYLRTDAFYDITTPPYANYITKGLTHANSGKTYTAAIKLCRFLHETPSPKRDMPYWCIAESYEQVMSTVWFQKLREIIPHEWIDWPRITWYNEKRGWPMAVPLIAMHGDPEHNWIIEFKSYEQGREKMQAASIGGAWFTEQFPWSVFLEVLRGCREYTFPSAVMLEQTPVDPEKSVDLEILYEDWLAGTEDTRSWSFFRLNTESALLAGHVTQEWFQTFFGSVSEEMQETRKHGLFSSYEGAIYQSFQPAVHLIGDDAPRDEDGYLIMPEGWWHRRAIDWGASEEHPLVCLWAARDPLGCWVVYDEYWSILQTEPWKYHIDLIKDRHEWKGMFHGNTYGDPSRPDLIREFGLGGIPIANARNEVYPGIETVRNLLKIVPATGEPRLKIDRVNCPFLARQMVTYRWLRSSGRSLNPKAARPEPLKKDDDCVDCLRYLCHTERYQTTKPDIIGRRGRAGEKAPREAQYVRSKGGVRLDKSGKSPYR